VFGFSSSVPCQKLCYPISFVKGDQEVTGSSRGNSLLQNLQGKAAYKDPKWSDPSPDPTQSGSFMHRAAFFLLAHKLANIEKKN
jgi:hypothetical protein